MATVTATADRPSADLDTLRAAYVRMRDAGRYAAGHAWDEAVLAVLVAMDSAMDPTPEEWVEAAERATVECERCHSTGTYNWGGTINGKPVHTGTCVRCEGKGHQDQDDMHRNKTYDRHAMLRACGF